MARIPVQKIAFVRMMKEKSENWFKKYTEKADNESKTLTLAANMEKDNEIVYSLLEEVMHSINELYDKIPTEKQIVSARTESRDSDTASATLTNEQLKELREREKRANQIYG